MGNGKQSQHSLKELQTRKSKLQAKLDALYAERKDVQESILRYEDQRRALDGQIRAATTEPTVSEHAVIQYLVQTGRLDLDAVKAEILTDELAGLIKQLGSGKFPLGNGTKAVVKQNVIVTIIGNGG